MKSLIKFATIVSVAAMASTAFAGPTINITGSTAARAAVQNTLLAIMTLTGTGNGYAYTDTASNGIGKATYSIFKGVYPGISGTTIVRCSWSGSASGIQSLTTGANVPLLPTITTVSSGGTKIATETGVATDSAPAHFSLSDVAQASTSYQSPALVPSNLFIVPFVWVANETAPVGMTDMTTQLARAILGNGAIPLSMFTGVAGDVSTYVYTMGRDAGSGTRITTLAEVGYGIAVNVAQYKGTYNSGTDAVTALTYDANNGESSGGTVATNLKGTSTAVSVDGNAAESCVLVSYLGTSDAATALSSGAKYLTYNGAAYSPEAIYNGLYTFWGYEKMYDTGGLDADQTAFKTQLKTSIGSHLGSTGLDASLMNVSRDVDGGLVGPL